MNIYKLGLICIALLFSLNTQIVNAAQEQHEVYGWQLMSERERNEYREKIRNLKTKQEREQFRAEHHEQMRKRAEAQGLSLPEKPRHEMGTGAGPGDGMGMGKGGGAGRR